MLLARVRSGMIRPDRNNYSRVLRGRVRSAAPAKASAHHPKPRRSAHRSRHRRCLRDSRHDPRGRRRFDRLAPRHHLISAAFGCGLLLGGVAVWWSIIGELLGQLTSHGAIGWILVPAPTVASWASLIAQAAVIATSYRTPVPPRNRQPLADAASRARPVHSVSGTEKARNDGDVCGVGRSAGLARRARRGGRDGSVSSAPLRPPSCGTSLGGSRRDH